MAASYRRPCHFGVLNYSLSHATAGRDRAPGTASPEDDPARHGKDFRLPSGRKARHEPTISASREIKIRGSLRLVTGILPIPMQHKLLTKIARKLKEAVYLGTLFELGKRGDAVANRWHFDWITQLTTDLIESVR